MASLCPLTMEPIEPRELPTTPPNNSFMPDILLGKCPPPDLDSYMDSYSCYYRIKLGEDEIGRFGLTWYGDIRAVGLGDFELYTVYRDRGYGRLVLESIVSHLQDKADLVYCYVESTNLPAIFLYNKIGKVCFDRRDNSGLIFVELYRKEMK